MGVSRPPGLASVAKDVGSPKERQTGVPWARWGAPRLLWHLVGHVPRTQVPGARCWASCCCPWSWLPHLGEGGGPPCPAHWVDTEAFSVGRVLRGEAAPQSGSRPQSSPEESAAPPEWVLALGALRGRCPGACQLRAAPPHALVPSAVDGLWQGWPDFAHTEGSLHPEPGSALSWEVAAVPQPPEILVLTVTLSSYTLTGGCCQSAPSSLRHRCPGGHRCCWGTVATASCAVAAGGAR